MSVFEILHWLCSVKFKFRPIDRFGLNRASSKPRTNAFNKLPQNAFKNGRKDDQMASPNKYCATLEKHKQIKNKSNLLDDAIKPQGWDSPYFPL